MAQAKAARRAKTKATTAESPSSLAEPVKEKQERDSESRATEESAVGGVTYLGDEDIAIELVRPSELNPRKHFDETSLNELADSLRKHGQMQNLTVRRVVYGYELIGGERRWRAALRADFHTVRCRVISCDDATAVELRGVENYRRAQLNAIEEAIWFQQMIETGRYNQTTLAEYLGITAGQVSNRLRLLKLPEAWRDRVAKGLFPGTHSRALAAWAQFPQVLAQAEKDFGFVADDEESALGEFDLSVSQTESHLRQIARAKSRPIDPTDWNRPKFDVEPHRDALDIHRVPDWDGQDDLRAFNFELWDQLQAEAEAAGVVVVDENEVDENSDDENSELPGRTTSQLSDWRLSRAFCRHFERAILAALKPDVFAVRLFIAQTVNEDVTDTICGGVDSNEPERSLWDVLSSLTAKNLPEFCFKHVTAFLGGETAFVDLGLVKDAAEQMGLEPLKSWRPGEALLDLCSDDQLRELFTDEMAKLASWKRERLIKELIAHWSFVCRCGCDHHL